MQDFVRKTLYGLTLSYYVRQLIIGCVIGGSLDLIMLQMHPNIPMAIFFGVKALLFPCARFVVHSVIGFMQGATLFIVPAIFLLLVKVVLIMVCWKMAIILAPVGMIGLFIYHSRAERSY